MSTTHSMSATHKAVPAEPVQWETMSLRVTAFYAGPLDVGPIRWWEELAGQASESKTVRAGVGQLVEQGTLGSRVLQLQIQPGRIDWLLLPKEDPESAGFSLLGGFGESKDYFSSLVFPWLATGPQLVRLAFGAQLVIPTPSVAVAMQIISEAIPHLNLKAADARDLVFQINQPAPGKAIPELGPINRLVKWQTIVRKKLVATLLPTAQAPVTTTEETAAYLEVDISTADPSGTDIKLPHDKLTALMAELAQNATDIVTEANKL